MYKKYNKDNINNYRKVYIIIYQTYVENIYKK